MTQEEKNKLIEGLINKHLKIWPSNQGKLGESCIKNAMSELIDLLAPEYAIVLKDQPWSLVHILNKLVYASKILLYQKDYDGQGWEEIEMCTQKAIEIINKLNAPPKQ